MYTYYVSAGSNMGDSYGYVERAWEQIQAHPLVCGAARSQWIETEPWGFVDQEPFVNGLFRCRTAMEPLEFLTFLQSLEAQAQRQRTIHWGPRTLDLDIVYGYKDGEPLTVGLELLQVPHPYFWDRTFVLLPLRELEPQFSYRGEAIDHRIATLEQNTPST